MKTKDLNVDLVVKVNLKKAEEEFENTKKKLEKEKEELAAIMNDPKAMEQAIAEMKEYYTEYGKIAGMATLKIAKDLAERDKIGVAFDIGEAVSDLYTHSEKSIPLMERVQDKLKEIADSEKELFRVRRSLGEMMITQGEDVIKKEEEKRKLLKETVNFQDDQVAVEIRYANMRYNIYETFHKFHKQEIDDLEKNKTLFGEWGNLVSKINKEKGNGKPISLKLGTEVVKIQNDAKVIEKVLKNIAIQQQILSEKIEVGKSAMRSTDEAERHYDEAYSKSEQQQEKKAIVLAQTAANERQYAKATIERLTQLDNKQQELDKKEQERAALAVEFQEGLDNRKIEEIKTVEAAQIDASGMQDILAQNNAKIAKQTAEAEKASLKTRAEQWKEYSEKVSAISNQISEVTSMVANSLGGMFGQLAESYSEQIESINGKIAAVDEEKKAALERATLPEDERTAREEELAQQKLVLESTTTDEQRNKADQRIAILEGELGAEDSINRDFDSKKASLEKEKEKKEKEKKKAEKMKKRLEMGQAIVEAVGNVAQGVTVALAKGPILGPILASIVGAAGAIQVGIMSKQLAKMEDGGLLGGKRHAQGGMRILGSNIEVEGGEYVVNRQSTDKNLGLLSYINSQRRELAPADIGSFFSRTSMPLPTNTLADMFQASVQVPMLPFETSMDTRILDAIESINFQPQVSVTDINTVQQNTIRVDEWTGL